MKKFLALFIGLFISSLAIAQSGGFPSRPSFGHVNIYGNSTVVPSLDMYNTSATTTNQAYQQQIDGSGSLINSFCNDSRSSCTAFETITRSGSTASLWSLVPAAQLANTLTLQNGSANLRLIFNATASLTAERVSDIRIGLSDGNPQFRLCDNAGTTCTAYYSVTRNANTATTITTAATTINFTATNLRKNGNDLLDSTDVIKSSVAAADVTITSNTTLADVSGMSITIPAGTYLVKVQIHACDVTTNAAGFKYTLAYAGTDGRSNTLKGGLHKALGVALTEQQDYYAGQTWSYTGGGTFPVCDSALYENWEFVVVSTVSGIFKMQAAQQTSSTDSVKVLAGSYIRAVKL